MTADDLTRATAEAEAAWQAYPYSEPDGPAVHIAHAGFIAGFCAARLAAGPSMKVHTGVTADDLTRLRAVAIEAAKYKRGDRSMLAGEAFSAWANQVTPPTVAALIDRVERAERERDEWRTHAAHNKADYKRICAEYAPRYRAWDEFRAAVEGLADTPNAVILPSELRGLLTEGADDGQ